MINFTGTLKVYSVKGSVIYVLIIFGTNIGNSKYNNNALFIIFFVIAESNLIIIFTIFPGSTYFKWFCSFYIYIVNGGTRCLHWNQYSKIIGSWKYTGTIKCQTFIYILRKCIGANFVFSQNVNFNLGNSNYILGNTNINLGNSNFILCYQV